MLVSNGVHECTSSTLAALQNLNPAGPEQLPTPETSTEIFITTESIEKSIRSFPTGGAPGPFGFRPSHAHNLINAVSGETKERLLENLAIFTRTALSGQLSGSLSCYVASARLIPLKKKNDGIRPICVGSFWRRLISKTIIGINNSDIGSYFEPDQVGVRTKNGAEAIIHATKRIITVLGGDNSYGALFVDFKNAFNLVNRAEIIKETITNFPSIAKWTHYLYQSAPKLYYESNTIENSEGAQQGCPMASLGFSLVLQKLILKIKSEHPNLPLNAWYLDDGTIIAKHNDLQNILKIIIDEGPSLGLFISLEKSCIWWPVTDSPEYLNYPPELTILREDGVTALGAPFGSMDYCETVVRKRINKIAEVIGNSALLENCQAQYILQKYCLGWPKFAFALRTCPPHFLENCLLSFDELMRESITKVIGGAPSDVQWMQITLPVAKGGLGITLAKDTAAPSFLASVHESLPVQQRLLSSCTIAIPQIDTTQALENLRISSGLVQDETNKIAAAFNTTRSTQSSLSRLVTLNNQSLLLDHNDNTMSDLARIHSTMGPHAGDWLNVTPISKLNLALSNNEFTRAVALRIGMSQINEPTICPACRTETIEVTAHHALHCRFSPERTQRHDYAVKAIYGHCQTALLHPQYEKKVTDESQHRGDILVPLWADGRNAFFDVGITNPCCPTYVRQASTTPGSSAQKYHDQKLAKYSEICEREDIQCVPLICESFGRWTSEAIEVFKRVSGFTATRLDQPKSEIFSRFMQKLSLQIQKSNVALIMARLPLP